VADSAGVGLADAVRALRAELTSAMAEGADQALRFELGPVEMEFLLEVNRTAVSRSLGEAEDGEWPVH